ncbi:hypothetical protein [Brevibacillus brevis]|uniref:hypothetical protein n=1 Tax=Brevibacillus brevis TaxID=1393 RepID=UPI0007D899B1|nr:hypothetical protein [Brevibacillus brevis]
MNIFPDNLHHYKEIQFSHGSNDVSEQEINKWINELIDEISTSENTPEMSCSSGNTWVCVTKMDDKEDEYHVVVAKNYWRGTVKKEINKVD